MINAANDHRVLNSTGYRSTMTLRSAIQMNSATIFCRQLLHAAISLNLYTAIVSIFHNRSLTEIIDDLRGILYLTGRTDSLLSLCMLGHETASSSAWCNNHKPPENRVTGQRLTIWSTVCRGFPHMHDWSEAWCHRTRLAAHRPWPVRNLFNVNHRRRGRLKAGRQMVRSVTSDWTDSYSSFQTALLQLYAVWRCRSTE